MAEESDKNLDELTVAELRERASEMEITGRSTMNKSELRQAVADAEEQTANLRETSSSSDSSESSSSESRPWKSSSSEDSGSDSDSSGRTEGDEIAAPSIGPNTVIEHKPPEERLDLDNISDVDAMGLDKRRGVVGKRVGASPAKQLAFYAGALGIIAVLAIGAILLASELDQPPDTIAVQAPWAEGSQETPDPLDFRQAKTD